MDRSAYLPSRRRVAGALAATVSVSAVGLLLPIPTRAAAPRLTPRQSEGPFYPLEIPADADNNLVQVVGRRRPASGDVVQVYGRVVDDRGRPLAGARVEIWQCDAFGRYHHPHDRGGGADPNFQGFGRATADAEGGYGFRTIKPVPYPGRTPHIHFAVSGSGVERLTTQMYLAGHPLNDQDFLYRSIRNPAARDSVTVAFAAAPHLGQGVEAGRFDLVLGRSL